jgi:hypothetical protein
MNFTEINEQVVEILKMSGSRERFNGVVTGFDQIGTTIFIASGERVLLAFRDLKNPVVPGDAVSFRIDGMRAVDLRKEIPAES